MSDDQQKTLTTISDSVKRAINDEMVVLLVYCDPGEKDNVANYFYDNQLMQNG